ncbi:MAG: 16S rRNA (cytosine(1402)-N(4))-methyltransferase RsmH [Pseudomonadales bacterium]|nr:16S rRNA (cytosine(1402)-N(4))-methyltransferase RsmH [Pseudomonadales bacterium]
MALHATVLKEEAVAALSIDPNGFYVDATFGRGGHTSLLLAQLGSGGRVLVLDRDPEAVAVAREISEQDSRLTAEHAAFSQLGELVRKHNAEGAVNGVLFDLGVSSPQLDDPDRGFSFMKDGPLDMRMDNEGGVSAEEWIHSASESEIADVLKRFGEEKFAKRMAAAIVRERASSRIETTGRLADIVKAAHPAWERDKHPATRAFQAIRIHINKEFEEIESGLDQALAALAPGGRLVAISFHSLEDRIVKRFIDKQAKGDQFPKGLPITADQLQPRLLKVGKAVKPSAAEIELNPRARSAVMRVAEKLS